MAEAVSKACCDLWSVSLVLNVVGEGRVATLLPFSLRPLLLCLLLPLVELAPRPRGESELYSDSPETSAKFSGLEGIYKILFTVTEY